MVAGLFNNIRIYYFHTWFVLVLAILSICFFLNTYLNEHISTSRPTVRPTKSARFLQQHAPEHKETTAACNLPTLDPFDKSILELLEPAPDIDCTSAKHPKLFRTNFDNKLIQMEKINGHCCYKTMERTTYSDLITKFSKRCTPITKRVTTISSSIEFIQVQCQIYNRTAENGSSKTEEAGQASHPTYADLFAFVPPKSPQSAAGAPRKQPRIQEDQLNIVILGLDGQSRMNFIRQMPLTYNYLMKNLSSSESTTGTVVVEMNGHSKVGDNTFPNVVPLLTGLNVAELVENCWGTKYTHFDMCPFIWKKFAAAGGYQTLYAEDSVWMGIFQYEKLGFYEQPTDYYLNPFVLQLSSKVGHEVQGNTKLCYGPRLAFEVLLEYMVKTFVRFKSPAPSQRRFFQFMWANSLFHDFLNHPKLGDELLYMTLEWLTTHGYLNNTFLILASDHGARWGSIRNTYQGRLEERLPMLYFLLPKWFEDKYSVAVHNLRENSHRLTTPFDLHETLIDFLHVQKNLGNAAILQNASHNGNSTRARGLSLFRHIPPSRTCADAGVDKHYCICSRMAPISSSLHFVRQAAQSVVRNVNQLISNYTEQNNLLSAENPCAKLRLAKVTSAMRKIDDNDDKNNFGYLQFKNAVGEDYDLERKYAVDIELQLSITVEPSKAVLEATAYMNRATNYEWEVSGDISRLNLYGEQSACVSDPVLQKYCYCTGIDHSSAIAANQNGTDRNVFDWYESKPLTLTI